MAGETMVGLIEAVGEEEVPYPSEEEGAKLMPRREALARALWKRAVDCGDLACAKLLIECLERRGSAKVTKRDGPLFTPADLKAAEKILAEWWAEKAASFPPRLPDAREVSGK